MVMFIPSYISLTQIGHLICLCLGITQKSKKRRKPWKTGSNWNTPAMIPLLQSCPVTWSSSSLESCPSSPPLPLFSMLPCLIRNGVWLNAMGNDLPVTQNKWMWWMYLIALYLCRLVWSGRERFDRVRVFKHGEKSWIVLKEMLQRYYIGKNTISMPVNGAIQEMCSN